MAFSKSDLALLGIGGGSAEEIVRPVVKWFLDGWPSPRPDAVDTLVTAVFIIGAALAWHWLRNRDPSLTNELTQDAAQAAEAAPAPAQGGQ